MTQNVKLLTLVLLLMLTGHICSAQVNEDIITGTWVGYYSYLKKNHPYKLELELNDGVVKGKGIQGEPNEEFIARLEGTFKQDKLKVKATEVLQRKSDGCLANINLSLVQVDEIVYLLEGTWSCGVGGRINLTRTLSTPEVASAPLKVEKEDVYTEEFLKGMKERKYHALFITIDDYKNEEIEDLNNPIEDGRSLEQLLTSQYNFDQQNVTFLENPTRQEIIDEMDHLSESLNDYDNLLIFYAGHGIWDEDLKQGYWLPSDSKLSSKGQWISNTTIRDYVRSMRSKHTLLVADACFSGGILKERSVSLAGKALFSLYNLPSRKAITSGTLTTVPDESVFSYYLLKNLEQNQNQVMSADQLFSKMKIAVINNSPNNQVPQYGAIHLAGDEGGDFIFIRNKQ